MKITNALIQDMKQVSKAIGYFKDADDRFTPGDWNALFKGHTLANDFTLDLLESTVAGSDWLEIPEESYLTYWAIKRVIVDWLAGKYNPAAEDEKIQKHLSKVLTN